MQHTTKRAAIEKSRKWHLGWENPGYVKRREIVADGNNTSFIAVFGGNDKAAKAVTLMKGWLCDNGYVAERLSNESNEYFSFHGKKNSTVLLGVGDISESVFLQCNDDEVETMRRLLGPFRAMKEYDLISLGELKHGRNRIVIPDSKIRAYSYSGIPTESEPAFLDPYTFYEFRSGRQLVGKAYLSYCDFEMGECAPTIQMFEVKKKDRRKGIGTMMYHVIEKVTSEQGFDRIWATDISTSEFWEATGFEIDLDEAVKYL